MKKQINIAIAEDHTIVREALITMLKAEKSFNIIFSVSNGRELIDSLAEQKPDIILLDIEMPLLSGKEALRTIKKRYPKIRVIILSSHFQKQVILDFIKMGANSFLPKDCNRSELITAIHSVYEEGQYFNKEVTNIMAKELASTSSPVNEEGVIKFSDIELSIIKMICQNKLNKEIAEALDTSIRTVEWHRINIMKAIQSKDVNDLIVYAIKHKLINVI